MSTNGSFKPATEPLSTFDDCILNCPIVHHIMRRGGSAQDCVVALVNQQRELLATIVKLESIAPKRITFDGRTFVWHCPDELIPEQTL